MTMTTPSRPAPRRVVRWLGGDSPAWLGEVTDQLRRALPDARLAVLPGQQHIAIDTAPELFATTVTEFLAAASVPGG
jgi:pimeloyl-ACP methyl ester carboxylesterase